MSHKWTHNLHTSKNNVLPEDAQRLRPKLVGTIINKYNIVQQGGTKYYVYNIVAWKMCNIKGA